MLTLPQSPLDIAFAKLIATLPTPDALGDHTLALWANDSTKDPSIFMTWEEGYMQGMEITMYAPQPDPDESPTDTQILFTAKIPITSLANLDLIGSTLKALIAYPRYRQ